MSERDGHFRVETTTGPWLFNPEQGFWIIGKINKERPREARIGFEVYPVDHRIYPLHKIPLIGRLAEKLPYWEEYGDTLSGNGRINETKIRDWQREYGDPSKGDGAIPIERVHLPFHWSNTTGFYNYFVRSVFSEPGTWQNRIVATWAAHLTRTVQSHHAEKLGRAFNAGANVHVNIVEEAVKGRQTGVLKSNFRYVRVENDLDWIRKKPDQYERERDPKRAIDAVERYGFEGVIYGLDHAFDHNRDPLLDFRDPELITHLRTIHLSGTEKLAGGGHSLIGLDDPVFWGVIREIKKISFPNPVSLCLDISPLAMSHMTPDQQLDYYRELVGKLES